MPHDAAYLRAMKNSIIGDLFTRTADDNYVTARWCAAQGLATDFLWLGVHALEKYLKAVLLSNGRSATTQRHRIVDLHDEVDAFAGDLLPTDLGKPDQLRISDWHTRTLRHFLEHLYANGNPDNRYLIFGFAHGMEDLHMLDQAVFAYRRLICPLDERVFPDDAAGAPTFTYRDQLSEDPRYFSSIGSALPLDRLIQARDEPPLRRTALNLNFSFAPDGYPHTPMPGFISAHHPVLSLHLLEPLASRDLGYAALGIEAAAWALANIQLPSDVRNQIRAAMDDARIRHPSLP